MPEAKKRRSPKAGRAGSSKPILFDTVLLSNFALAAGLEWLCMRYAGRGLVTTAVLDELAAGAACGLAALAPAAQILKQGGIRVISLEPAERKTFTKLRRFLGAGEAASIASAVSRGAVVATGDRAARRACEDHGLAVTGTIGILKASVADGSLLLNEAEGMHTRMVDAGFYSPVKHLADLV
mgnify:CR=1 FL=1